MDESLYAAPRATVADIERGEPPARPPAVNRALACMWGALAIDFASSCYTATTKLAEPGVNTGEWVMISIATAILFGIVAASNIAVARGRNWGRIVYFFVFAFGLLVLADSFADAFGLDDLAEVASTALSAVAIWLLLTRPAREWFAAMKGR